MSILRELEKLLHRLNKACEKAEEPVSFPMYLYASEQLGDNMFRYKFTLPPVNPKNPVAEVVNREISKTIDGGTPEIQTLLAADALVTDWVTAEEDQLLRVELRDIDNKGNKSTTPIFREFTVVDDVPPASPEGQLDISEQEEV